MAAEPPEMQVKQAKLGEGAERPPGGLPEVADPEQLRAWLREQPPEVAIVIAVRAALRVLPLCGAHLPSFRANFICWAALKYPIHEMRAVAADAALIIESNGSRSTAVDGAGHLASTAAAAAAEAVAAGGLASIAAVGAPEAVAACIAAADLTGDEHAPTECLNAIAGDFYWLRRNPQRPAEVPPYTLIDEPLWLQDVRRNKSFSANFPPWVRQPFDAFDKSELVQSGPWRRWVEWYRAILPNSRKGKPRSAFGERNDAAIAMSPPDFWEREPKEVMEDIDRLLRGAPIRYRGLPSTKEKPAEETRVEASASEPETGRETEAPAAAAHPSVWLAQCSQGDWVWPFVQDAQPGSTIPWKIGSADIDAMRAGDPVVYWRTVTKGRDRGGIIGAGRIVSTEPQEDENGVPRIRTEVVELYDSEPLGRDEVIRATGLDPGHWHFSLYQVPAEVADRMDALLRENRHEPVVPEQTPEARRPTEGAGETPLMHDAPKRDEDLLGRAELAFILAARLNRVWDELNPPASGERAAAVRLPRAWSWIVSFNRASPQVPAKQMKRTTFASNTAWDAGFVVHLDAPWGGGKTTFANYLACILNPYSGAPPDWLSTLPLANERNWPKGFRRPWHIVTFNAWQHQHVEPPWWCFYQAIRKQTAAAVLRETNVQAENPAIPEPDAAFSYRGRLGRAWDWLAGWVREMGWRLFTPELRWSGVLTLATFGLAVLLVSLGWLRVDIEEGNIGGNFADASGTVVAIIAILAGGGSFIWTIVSTFTGTLLTGTPDAAKNYSLGSGDPLERFRRHFARMMNRLKRPVLVVVDDIDRCEPGFVVELVRGMQTILKSPRVVFLLLGDRDWIEQSFAETHKAMKAIPVGPEHSFGGRFVEKAIQLSLMLPDVPADERHRYVRSLLGIEGDPADPVENLANDDREEVQSTLAALDEEADPMTRDRRAASLRERVYSLQSSDLVKEAVTKAIDRKVALRSAADEKVQKATQHRLEPIAEVLPPNPRQIKRIINTISLFQEIARIRSEVQPETQRWRQLALWIVLMTEWPQTWATLASKPDLLTRLHNTDDATPIDGLDEATVRSWVEAIRAKPEIMALLDFPRYGSGPRNGIPEQWRDARIDANAVRRLTAILPPVGGAMLPRPQPEEEKVGNGETS